MKDLLEKNEELGKKADLLTTIRGISKKTAVAILSELPNIQTFETVREAAAFCKLTPTVRQSGASVEENELCQKLECST